MALLRRASLKITKWLQSFCVSHPVIKSKGRRVVPSCPFLWVWVSCGRTESLRDYPLPVSLARIEDMHSPKPTSGKGNKSPQLTWRPIIWGGEDVGKSKQTRLRPLLPLLLTTPTLLLVVSASVWPLPRWTLPAPLNVGISSHFRVPTTSVAFTERHESVFQRCWHPLVKGIYSELTRGPWLYVRGIGGISIGHSVLTFLSSYIFKFLFLY